MKHSYFIMIAMNSIFFYNINIMSMESPKEYACLTTGEPIKDAYNYVFDLVEIAAEEAQLTPLERFLKSGTLKRRANQKYNNGNTLLQLILSSSWITAENEAEYIDFIKRLLESTAIRTSSVNDEGKTALDIAKEKGLKKIGRVLIKALAQEQGIARALEAEQGLPREIGKKILAQ